MCATYAKEPPKLSGEWVAWGMLSLAACSRGGAQESREPSWILLSAPSRQHPTKACHLWYLHATFHYQESWLQQFRLWALGQWQHCCSHIKQGWSCTVHWHAVSHVDDTVGEGPNPVDKQPWDMVGNRFKPKLGPWRGQLCKHTNSYYWYSKRQKVQGDHAVVPLACFLPATVAELAQENSSSIFLLVFRRQPGCYVLLRGDRKSDRLAKRYTSDSLWMYGKQGW